MQILNPEFLTAVKGKLDKLEDGSYLTREQVCVLLGVNKDMVGAVTLALMDPMFSNYESVKSRGIRRKKVA
jgi:hypothetical protein